MRNRNHHFLAVALLLAFAVEAPADAQEATDPIPARVRYFEGSVTVQRVHAAQTSAALVNLPVDAGDRLWTELQGRAELTFGDGTTVWLDHLTTVDVVALPRASEGDTIIRLWGGSLIIERPSAYSLIAQAFRVDTVEATIVMLPQGSYRIDLDDEHRGWLSVRDGTATINAGGLTKTVAAGQTTYVAPGTAPDEVVSFNTAGHDDFSGWQVQRSMAVAETQDYARDRGYVPEETRQYAGDLERNGDWVYYDDFAAYAWRPSVPVGWAPYRNGRWVFSYSGWTWVPYATWGWATSHYGRWHHTPIYGWVWFPGSVYSPGWVSWYAGSGYMGWSPLGYYDRPFLSVNLFFSGHFGYGTGYHGGHNYNHTVGRGGKAIVGLGYARDLKADHGWTFVNAEHFGNGKTALRATSRNAVPRQENGTGVSFAGKLRSRKPSILAKVTHPQAMHKTGVRSSSTRGGRASITTGRATAQPNSSVRQRSGSRAKHPSQQLSIWDRTSLLRRPTLLTRPGLSNAPAASNSSGKKTLRPMVSRFSPRASRYQPKRPAISNRSSVLPSRSFSAPSRGTSRRSSGRSAARRPGHR